MTPEARRGPMTAGTPRLHTERLDLVPLGPWDAPEMAGVLAAPDLYHFIGGGPPDPRSLAERYARLAVGHSSDATEIWHNWVVRTSADGVAVGTVQATVAAREPTAEMAWVIGLPWQGRGYATEAAAALLGWLRADGVRTVTALVNPEHAASEAVARRVGLAPTEELVDGERAWLWGASTPRAPWLRRLPTAVLTAEETSAIRAILKTAFGPGDEAFTDDDWSHALGGVHFVLEVDGEIVTHAALVERQIDVGDRRLRTGYVEAVATIPDRERRGHGSRVLEALTAQVRDTYELGALGTGRHHFYERLGWQTWQGPAYVRSGDGRERTPDDEGYILVLRTPTSPPFDLTEPIICEWRPGDAW